MARWQPDGTGRLQHAAVTLFLERGYANVSVADIADRAGLTKRTFFNHFPDKREVVFAGAPALVASILDHLDRVDEDVDALDACVMALTQAGEAELSAYREVAHLRSALIASSSELQERDLIKRAAMTSAIAEALARRGLADRQATLTAQVAVTIFTTAYQDWTEQPDADFETLMQHVLDDLRRSVNGLAPAPAATSSR